MRFENRTSLRNMHGCVMHEATHDFGMLWHLQKSGLAQHNSLTSRSLDCMASHMRARGDAIAPSQLVFVLQPTVPRPQSQCDRMSQNCDHEPARKQDNVLLPQLMTKANLAFIIQ